MKYQILLFYKYVHIDNPEEVRDWQREICQRLGIKGRLIVAEEGINNTLEGTVEATEQYIKELQADPRFQEIHFKKSEGTGAAFPKLSVKFRPEIVSLHLGEQDLDPNQVTGKHITAEELQGWFESDEEFYIVDMRNDYEHKSGYFKETVFAPLGNFRDLPEVVEQISHLKDKKVLTVCTGGIRCEKASGFLVEQGFSNIHQLYGGMVTYMEKYPNQGFLGKLYVFDQRVLMGFNTDAPEHVIVGKCDLCGNSSENYINCANIKCHKHVIACEECFVDGVGYCGDCVGSYSSQN